MKTLIYLIMTLCYTTSLYAQSNLYQESKQIQGDGYTYQCEISCGILVSLYNTDHQFIKAEQVNRNTGVHYSSKDTYTPHFNSDNWTRPKCYSIVKNAFSAAQKQKVKGQLLTVSLYIHPDTGKITDIEFEFSTKDGFATVPISVYRQIELEIKKNIWFTTTAHGKQWNYILLWWQQDINR